MLCHLTELFQIFTYDWFDKKMALICKRISLLNYSKLPPPISFLGSMVNFTNKQVVWLWAPPMAL